QATAAASFHRRGPARLRRAARSALPPTGHVELLHLRAGPQADGAAGSGGVHQAGRPSRADPPRRGTPAAGARPKTKLRRGHLARLVPRRRRRRGQDAAAIGLPRAFPPLIDLLVLLRFSGYSDARSFLRVRGSGPWLTRSGDCRLSE